MSFDLAASQRSDSMTGRRVILLLAVGLAIGIVLFFGRHR
jgi:hypothetical protein